MTNDLLLARETVVDGYSLVVGEPVLLQEYLKIPNFVAQGPYLYPSLRGLPALVKELQILHPGYEVIIANGAKQAIAACMHAMARAKGSVYHRAPYWPSYPTLACMNCVGFTDAPGHLNPMVCVTSPNNPDGYETLQDCDLWDSVYAHQIYGWSGCEPGSYRMRVGSASKMLGLSGVRVGWVLTKDPELAKRARTYVEITTSGVSLPAQEYVAHALAFARNNFGFLDYQNVHEAIVRNGTMFRDQLGEYCDWCAGVPGEGRGMFAFFQIKPKKAKAFVKALKTAKVAMLAGAACGVIEGDTWRCNMCHNNEYTEKALKAVREKMK